MLLSLSIRHFVIVDTLELDFCSGFTVLTGETGAGKSIILDALGLLLGGRGDGSLVRHGEERAELAATFDLQAVPELARQLGTPHYLPPPAGALDQGEGYGLVQAARGSLGHWIQVTDGRISRYQIIAPTTWNFSPRDESGQPGPLEQALLGLPAGEGAPPTDRKSVV